MACEASYRRCRLRRVPGLHASPRVAGVALVAEPRALSAPVDLLGFPDIRASAAEPERLESHRLQGTVPGEDHQVGPGDLPAVLLLDRPEQPPRLVEVSVVRPAVEGRKPLQAGPL